MRFLDLVNRRTSVRHYDSNRGVDRQILERCLDAARMSPSACNAQPWHFVVVDEPSIRNQVARETHNRVVSFNRFAVQAPVLVVVVAEESALLPRLGGLLKGTRYSLMDIGIAAEHFCLQATEEGLGSCMLGWFNERAIRRILGIPASRRIALVMTVGYAAAPRAPRKREHKPLDQIRSYNRYWKNNGRSSA